MNLVTYAAEHSAVIDKMENTVMYMSDYRRVLDW
jgi:hypothetical protein